MPKTAIDDDILHGEYHLALYRYEESENGDTVSIGPLYWGEDKTPLTHKEFCDAAIHAWRWIDSGSPRRWARIDLLQTGNGGITLKTFDKKGKEYSSSRTEIEDYD